MAQSGLWRGSRGNPAGLVGLSNNAGESLLLLRNFEESGLGWFWSTDEEGRLTYLSGGVATSFGGEKCLGSAFADLFVQADSDSSVGRSLSFILIRKSKFEKLTVRAAVSDDERVWLVSGCPQFDAAGRFTGYRGSGVDITEQRRSSEHASQLAMYDSLTGLPNRLHMTEVLESNLVSVEHHRRPCAVMLIDLDRFKQVNDTLGHLAGDSLLKQVAERLLRIVGDREKVFRLGGDEFQVILRDCEDRGILGNIATEIIGNLSQPYSAEGSRCIIGASIGIAVGPADGRTSQELIRNADLALYASKDAGRGCFRFFSSDFLKAAEDRRSLEEDLRDAVANGEIELAYQPVVNAKTNCVTGVEALVRWRHPERGLISPALFIPIAEEANLIEPLGEWVLRKACEDAAKWPGRLRLAVNVSPIQFANESLPKIIMSALATSGLSPDQLELEITEGVFLSEAAEADTVLTTLKDIGVRLALDDFGTGYSSLGYLRTAPFDKIKIDQSFIQAATLPGSRNAAIISAIVALAGALEMETTAEGIESLDQLQLVLNLGVSHIQGFVYSKAVTSDELGQRLEAGDWIIPPSGPARQRSDRKAVYRKVGAIHGNRYRTVLIRNISESGALIEGLVDVASGTLIIIDFGDGQLEFATVRRASRSQQGIAFERPLVSDGIGGYCTSHRVSPYLLATAGVPAWSDPDVARTCELDYSTLDGLAEKLGLIRADQVQADAASLDWIGERSDDKSHSRRGPASPSIVDLEHSGSGLGGSDALALDALALLSRRKERERYLTHAEATKLIDATLESRNRQLKFIVVLLMLTGARQRDLLDAQWAHIDLEHSIWRVPHPRSGEVREVHLSPAAVEVIRRLPRWDECPYLIANPKTKEPYRSYLRSWDAARTKAGLPDIEIDDLSHCGVVDAVGAGWLLDFIGKSGVTVRAGIEPARNDLQCSE